MVKINWKYQFEQYGVALAPAIFVFAALSVYLFYRRGYYDLYIINKALAGGAVVLLGVVLLIGPLSRFFSFPDRFIQYRKELGIISFLLAISHGVASLFFLPLKFPLARYLTGFNWPFIFGSAASVLLAAIFAISNDRVMNAFGREKWWKAQYWGVRFAFVLVFSHVFIMKWKGWLAWYQSGGGRELARPDWPGAGILVGWFMALVVLVRLAELGGQKLGKAVWYAGIVGLPAIYLATFLWGRQFIK